MVKTLDVILLLCRVASIFFGLIAAYYWFKASSAKVTTRDNPHNPDIESRGNPDSEGHRVLYTSTAIEQSRLNKIAAIHTAIAVLSQAAASLFDALR